jgi:hypothetical protein
MVRSIYMPRIHDPNFSETTHPYVVPLCDASYKTTSSIRDRLANNRSLLLYLTPAASRAIVGVTGGRPGGDRSRLVVAYCGVRAGERDRSSIRMLSDFVPSRSQEGCVTGFRADQVLYSGRILGEACSHRRPGGVLATAVYANIMNLNRTYSFDCLLASKENRETHVVFRIGNSDWRIESSIEELERDYQTLNRDVEAADLACRVSTGFAINHQEIPF